MNMDNKELIDDNRIAIVSGLFSPTINELLSRNLKALQDAEDEINGLKEDTRKQAAIHLDEEAKLLEEISLLKAELEELRREIQELRIENEELYEVEAELEQFKKEKS